MFTEAVVDICSKHFSQSWNIIMFSNDEPDAIIGPAVLAQIFMVYNIF